MRIVVLALVASLALQGCGTIAFTPAEYPLRDGLIPQFSVAGQVAITNAQPSKDPVIVYSYMGSELSSNLNAITEVMVQQATKELQKNGKALAGSSSKT